jgi:hypothetical protein
MVARNTSVAASCAAAADLIAKMAIMQKDINSKMAHVQERLSTRAASTPGMAIMEGDAVMVEVRALGRIPLVLSNFRSVLPPSWVVNFWHGATNSGAVLAAPALASSIAAGSLKLRRLVVDGVPASASTFKLPHYQKLITSPEFWNSFPRTHLLLFEADSVLCPSPAVPLRAFANVAFVGAPWSQSKQFRWAELERASQPPHWCFNLQHCVGNSGLSLWRRDVLQQVLSDHLRSELTDAVLDYLEQPGCVRMKSKCLPPKRGGFWGLAPASINRRAFYGKRNGTLETGTTLDVWMSRTLQAVEAGHAPRRTSLLAQGQVRAVPPEDEAALFSVETSYSGSYAPIGAHKPWHYLSPMRFDQLMQHCAPVRELHAAMTNDASGLMNGSLSRGHTARDERTDVLGRCGFTSTAVASVAVAEERAAAGRRLAAAAGKPSAAISNVAPARPLRPSQPWAGPAGESCAVLVHGSDRAESRPFWGPILLGIDRHLPPLCQTYLSYGSADEEAQLALRGISRPVTLLRRGDGGQGQGWSGAVLADLDRLANHTWIFHVLDDACIPDPIHDASLRAVLDTAQAQNASTISLYPRSFGFWNLKGARPALVAHPDAGDSEGSSSNGRRHGALEFYRATTQSRLVIQQNFALWRRDSFVETLRRVGLKATPWAWEQQLDRLSPGHREKAWPDIRKAMVVGAASGHADALLGVEDAGHGGRVKDGFSRCAWIRFTDRVGLARDTVPGGAEPGLEWPGASYDFCTLRGAIGEGAHVLKASPCLCRLAKAPPAQAAASGRPAGALEVKGVICGCNLTTT